MSAIRRSVEGDPIAGLLRHYIFIVFNTACFIARRPVRDCPRATTGRLQSCHPLTSSVQHRRVSDLGFEL
jgi:hypothetical protein